MTDKAREEFEAWYVSVWLEPEMNDKSNQNIHTFKNQLAAAWMASREAIEVELPSIQCVELHSYSHRDVLAYCEKAITAAGLKVKP